MHTLEPSSLAIVPFGQLLHGVAPPGENVPCPHMSQEHRTAPAIAEPPWPGSQVQDRQLPAPSEGAYLPAAHSQQLERHFGSGSAALANLPGGHFVHKSPSPQGGATVPLRHATQAVPLGVKSGGVQFAHGAAPPGPNVPAAQLVQLSTSLVAPAAAFPVPAGHLLSEHVALPPAAHFPAGHSAHDAAAAPAENMPAGHAVQLAVAFVAPAGAIRPGGHAAGWHGSDGDGCSDGGAWK